MLRERRSSAPRKVRVFYERKDPQHTLFCRKTFLKGFHRALNESFRRAFNKSFRRAFIESQPGFGELSTKVSLPCCSVLYISYRTIRHLKQRNLDQCMITAPAFDNHKITFYVQLLHVRPVKLQIHALQTR